VHFPARDHPGLSEIRTGTVRRAPGCRGSGRRERAGALRPQLSGHERHARRRPRGGFVSERGDTGGDRLRGRGGALARQPCAGTRSCARRARVRGGRKPGKLPPRLCPH